VQQQPGGGEEDEEKLKKSQGREWNIRTRLQPAMSSPLLTTTICKKMPKVFQIDVLSMSFIPMSVVLIVINYTH